MGKPLLTILQNELRLNMRQLELFASEHAPRPAKRFYLEKLTLSVLDDHPTTLEPYVPSSYAGEDSRVNSRVLHTDGRRYESAIAENAVGAALHCQRLDSRQNEVDWSLVDRPNEY